jgi:AcrR family transcriptional regulator
VGGETVAEVASSRSRGAVPTRGAREDRAAAPTGGARESRAAAPARGARGANGFAPGRERVSEIQRARIVTAITELVREGGVAGITVAHVVERSGVSRRTFYELFSDRDDCLLAAFEQALGRAAAIVLPAYGTAGAWEQRIRAGLAALLGFLDEEPAMGGLLVVDALAAERPVIERRATVVQALIDAVHRGGARPRGGADAKARPGRIVAEGAVGAVLAVIHARLSARDPKPLAGLLNELMGMIVLPYQGPEAAVRELRQPSPRPRRRPAAPATPADPLRELDMRLTYRTVRVLMAIAERPGASSRGVADASGIADQGQMSKLLWRLEHLGLIANTVERQGRGEPNAWSLTPRGEQVQRAIHAQTGR